MSKNSICEDCMNDTPYSNCCKYECGEHEFCKDCKFKLRQITKKKECEKPE